MWQAQLSLSEKGWRVIAPHFRGMDGGVSDPPAVSVDDYAGDVIDLIDGLHIEDAVIAGVSMGGYVAFALFRHAPRYVRGLILADTRAEPDTPEGVEGRKKTLALLRDRGVQPVVEEMLPRLLGETTRRERLDVVDTVKQLADRNPADAVAGAISVLMTRPDSRPLLASIHCPTLIVVGAEDILTPPAMSEAMQRGIAGSELVVIPAAGHLANLERPDAFNAALAKFLEFRV
jgi:pimeloyl-ACP methyl ester carboxylesterase